MHFEENHYYSPILSRDMYYNVYGHSGKPCLVFPSQDGMHGDFADWGMVDTIRPWIDAGQIQLFTVDTVDRESWSDKAAPLHERSARQEAYFQHIASEFAPLIANREGHFQKILSTGCSLGGTHAALTVLRCPQLFDATIAISPCFDARVLFEGQMNATLYHSSPVDFLAEMQWYHPFLNYYRDSAIHVVIGQGAWEGDLLPGVRETDRLLAERNVGAWFDYWGFDVAHDWPWWRKMLPYHLEKIMPL